MSTCVLLQIKAESNPWLRQFSTARSFGINLSNVVKKRGGQTMARFHDGVLEVAVQGLAPALVAELTAIWFEGEGGKNGPVNIVQLDHFEMTAELIESRFSPGSIIREPLTRSLLFSLPEGAYLVSNIGLNPYAERVGSLRERAAAWSFAKAQDAAGRLCDVYWTEGDFNAAIQQRRNLLEGNSEGPLSES